MMTTALKNVAFKMDSDTLDLASEVIKENGYNLNKVMRLYLKNVAITKKIDLPTEEELDNEFLFVQLKSEVKQRVSDVQNGKYYSDSDLVERYGL
ncbi:TPA: antitoxin [Streptococcus suis]|nr:antitoxin [Streptococcus suis]HEM3538426.1 antitoxin [Streptococcus suis]HEM3538555.1 antitoxin [Streptococcus suis]HEM3602967.1 antitoxin [Streptococcus suis]HEM3603005.1 antitoxin [Streptococcus suis]